MTLGRSLANSLAGPSQQITIFFGIGGSAISPDIPYAGPCPAELEYIVPTYQEFRTGRGLPTVADLKPTNEVPQNSHGGSLDGLSHEVQPESPVRVNGRPLGKRVGGGHPAGSPVIGFVGGVMT